MKTGNRNKKILIAGIGGQGIVYLTNIIVEAAMLSDIPVSVSEIHGLSQRGGVVTSAIGLGEHCTGFIGHANVDFLFGLETLETQRCLPYLHKNSNVIFGDYRIAPYAVNAEMAKYPDVNAFVEYLSKQCMHVIFVKKIPENFDAVLYNIFLLGKATQLKNFPINAAVIKQAINNTVMEYHLKKSHEAFEAGMVISYKL